MDVRGCLAGERAFAELPQHLTPAGIDWRFSELACEQIVASICAKGAPYADLSTALSDMRSNAWG
jgi:hypothetical protein